MLNETEVDSKAAVSWARGEVTEPTSSSGDFSQEMGKAIEETLRMLEAQ